MLKIAVEQARVSLGSTQLGVRRVGGVDDSRRDVPVTWRCALHQNGASRVLQHADHAPRRERLEHFTRAPLVALALDDLEHDVL